jgi:hypothetical protein
MSRRTLALAVLTALLAWPGEAQEIAPSPPSLQLEGGTAVILASLIDSAGQRLHRNDFKCIVDSDIRACRKASQDEFQVVAERIACSESDVATGTFSCEVAGTEKTASGRLTGHPAFELFSALVSAGVRKEGAAGHMEVVTGPVRCALDMATLRRKVGGGASCTLTAL